MEHRESPQRQAGDASKDGAPSPERRVETATSIQDLPRERLLELLEVYAKNWLAHDGCWFQAVERQKGWEEANHYNTEAWKVFTRVEARRILRFLGRAPGGGVEALAQALRFRLYATLNEQEIEVKDERHLIFRMRRCRVQEARRRKGLPLHRCKAAGIEEYTGFAQTIDPRFRTEVLVCPPDPLPPGVYCAWSFTLEDGPVGDRAQGGRDAP